MKDLFGRAILDFQTNNNPKDLVTETSISEADSMEVSYLFRDFDKMPKIEQRALQLSHGKILDIGCGAGSHSLHLQNLGHAVFPIDISPNAIEACKLRGLTTATATDFMLIENQKFDTILLLMNGTGICGTLDNLPKFLMKLKDLLAPNGQILIDSSDIIYMFDDDDDGGTRGEPELSGAKGIPSEKYYGEIEFIVSYKSETEEPFHWLYLDFNTLQNAAIANGLKCEFIVEGEHFDYLAKLSV